MMKAPKMNGKSRRRSQSKVNRATRELKTRDRKAKPFVTHVRARALAARHVLKRIFEGAMVRDGAEARLGPFLQHDWKPEDVWVVYKNQEGIGFRSSEVVVVCKRTGRVLYDGSAFDEG